MTNVGEDKDSAKPLDGQPKITSRGLEVFVEDEKIFISEGQWKNASGAFDTLEEAVMDAINRLEDI
jgi:hypothetical protein